MCRFAARNEPPFSFRLAEKKTAVHGQKKRRFPSQLDLNRPSWDQTRGPRKRPWVDAARSCVGRGPRPRNLHIPRFWFAPKAHSFRCSASPHENRSAGFSRGPRSFRLSATRIGIAGTGKDRKDQRSFPLPLAWSARVAAAGLVAESLAMTTPAMHPSPQMRRRSPALAPCPAHPAESNQVCTAPSRSTKRLKQKRRNAPFCAQAISLWTVHGPFLFFKKKRNGGCIPPAESPLKFDI